MNQQPPFTEKVKILKIDNPNIILVGFKYIQIAVLKMHQL